MKLVTYRYAGRTAIGILDGDEVMPLAADPELPSTMVDFVALGAEGLRRAATLSGPRLPLADVTLQAPIRPRNNIMCVGKNYYEHAKEFAGSGFDASQKQVVPDEPVIFTKALSSVTDPGAPVNVSADATHTSDYEGELAVVIGRRGRAVSPDDSLPMIAGYACFMDGTLRDFQRHTSQFTPGKNFDRSGAFGPFVVTVDELGDGSGLAIATTVDGQVVQHSSTSSMIHDVAHLVSYCSQFTTLEPGDVIATGTPSGVGAARRPPRWLVPGDEVVVSIERVGELRNVVIAAPATDGGGRGSVAV